MPYAIAAALVFGDAGIDSFLEARRNDPRLRAMIERITLEPDPAMADLDEPEITLMWADDTSRSCRIDIPLGDPRNPLDDARLLAKYRSLARAAIGEAEADTLADLVSRMDDVRDVREILMLLKARDGGRANSSIRELE